ncbi:MAG: cyclophilin-like fold protein [Roseburia sp.]|nr:cyclophilin-like fold protein [Roseburia sp.]
MKKLLVILATFLMLMLGPSACSNKPTGGTNGTNTPSSTTVAASDEVLVAYFSCTNTTEGIADSIVEITGGTRYRIQPKVPYTEDDLRYYTDGRADREQADPTARPEIDGSVEDMNTYKIVFLGYPIWHGQAPKIIYTFLESYDFSGKTIVPFCTSHSSGIGSSDTNLHSLAPNAEWKDGKRFAAGAMEESVNDWIDSLDIKIGQVSQSMKFYFTIGSTHLAAEFEDNAATAALKERLKTSPVTIEMSEYGGFEKVGDLGFSLPTDNKQITTQPCDFVLYQGDKLVIFYGSNSWSYTRLGKITGVTADELHSILGSGSTTVTLSLSSVANFDLKSGVNGKAPTVILSSGYEMPVLGIGTYSLHGETCVNSVLSALESGVRLIDTAYMYGNEEQVGQAVRQSGIPREEIFVITKIYPGEQFLNPEKAIQDALDNLDIGYIDMMLLHHPGTNDVQAYKAIEKFVAQGKIRSIGLSNWYVEEIDDFISKVDIKPALVQNEIHPYYQEKTVVPYMHDLGIVMQAWYPFGGRGYTGALLSDQTIVGIANAHNVSAAQVILRWHLQRGVVAIPGSSNPAHILENISVFDFELTASEMNAIAALDRNEKHDWY